MQLCYGMILRKNKLLKQKQGRKRNCISVPFYILIFQILLIMHINVAKILFELALFIWNVSMIELFSQYIY